MTLDILPSASLRFEGDSDKEILGQIRKNEFSDILALRSIQKNILFELDFEEEVNNIDIYVQREDTVMNPLDFDGIFPDDEEFLEEELYRISEEITERIESYESFIEIVRDSSDKEDLEQIYQSLDQDLDLIKSSLNQLYQDTERTFYKPFQDV